MGDPEPKEIYIRPELTGLLNIPASLSEMFSFEQSTDISPLHRAWQRHAPAYGTPGHELWNSQPMVQDPRPTNHQPWYPQPTSHGTRNQQTNNQQPWDLRSVTHRTRDRQPRTHGPLDVQRMTYRLPEQPPRIYVSGEPSRRTHRSLQPQLRAYRRDRRSRATGSLYSSSREGGALSLPLTVPGSTNSRPRYNPPESQPRVHMSLDPSYTVHGLSDPRQRAYESLDLPFRGQESLMMQYQCLALGMDLQENQVASQNIQRSDYSDNNINLMMQQGNYYAPPYNTDIFFQAMQGIKPVKVEEPEQESDIVVHSPMDHTAPYSEHSNERIYNTPRIEPSSVTPSECAAATALQSFRDCQGAYRTPTTISEQSERTRVRNPPRENCYEIPMTLCSNVFGLQPEEVSRDPMPPSSSALHQTRYSTTNTGIYLVYPASYLQVPIYTPARISAVSSTFSLPLSETYSTSHHANTSSSMTHNSSYQNSFISFANSLSENVSAFPYRHSTTNPPMSQSVYAAPLLPSRTSTTTSSSSLTTPHILNAPPQKKVKKSSRGRNKTEDN